MRWPDEVVRHDVDALEVGISVYSKTRQLASGAPVGGCVIDLFEDSVVVMVSCYGKQGPETREIDHEDIDWEVTDWGTRNAGVVAMQLFAWLAIKSGNTRERMGDWAQLAVKLQTIRDGGTYPPRAERRYQDRMQAKRAAS